MELSNPQGAMTNLSLQYRGKEENFQYKKVPFSKIPGKEVKEEKNNTALFKKMKEFLARRKVCTMLFGH